MGKTVEAKSIHTLWGFDSPRAGNKSLYKIKMEKKALETLRKYLKAWSEGRYRKMYKYSQITWKSNHSENALEKLYKDRQITDYRIGEVELRQAAICVEVKATVNSLSEIRKAMVICETGPYAPTQNGVWGVNPLSVL